MSGLDDLAPWERTEGGQRLLMADYEAAEHLSCCRGCAAGSPCPDGDSAFEAEFRAYAQYRRDYPDDAHAYVRDQADRWDAA